MTTRIKYILIAIGIILTLFNVVNAIDRLILSIVYFNQDNEFIPLINSFYTEVIVWYDFVTSLFYVFTSSIIIIIFIWFLFSNNKKYLFILFTIFSIFVLLDLIYTTIHPNIRIDTIGYIINFNYLLLPISLYFIIKNIQSVGQILLLIHSILLLGYTIYVLVSFSLHLQVFLTILAGLGSSSILIFLLYVFVYTDKHTKKLN